MLDALYRANLYRSYFKKKWGLMQLEKLNSTLFICFVIVLVNMDKVNDLINEGVDFVEEVSLCFYINE